MGDQVVCRIRFGRTLDIPFKTDIVLRNARRDRVNAASVRQIAPLIAPGKPTPTKSCPPATAAAAAAAAVTRDSPNVADMRNDTVDT